MENKQQIFNDLMDLSATNEAFYFVDQILANKTYRIFLYRLASYSDWLAPHANESRGITFHVDETGNMIDLVSRPFHKFFNAYENPFVMDLDFSEPTAILDKMDGSLISTMNVGVADHGGPIVWLKSKGSLFSDQATAANQLIHTIKYEPLLEFLYLMLENDCTVCMEYTGPENRIVIGYMEEALTVLSIRDNDTGVYIPLEILEYDYPDATQFFVKNHVEDIEDPVAFAENVINMEKVEGFVFWLPDVTVKMKTTWYMVLHHLKDSINSKRRLYEAVVNETIDDVRAQFFDDPVALKIISDMEELVVPIYNSMVELVETFYEDNKHLERKEYAIKGQVDCGQYFGLAMGKYLGREPDYKAYMVKNRKDYGIKDDPKPTPTGEENE
jgi:T4 RnlA family RNA ligase